MNPETQQWLEEVRARTDRLRVDIKEAVELASTPAERVYEHTVNDLLSDLRKFDALVIEQEAPNVRKMTAGVVCN